MMDKCRSPHILLVRILALHIRLTQLLSKAAFYIFFSSGMNPQIIIWMMQSQEFFILETLKGLPRGKSSNVSAITHKNGVRSLLSLFSDFCYPQV